MKSANHSPKKQFSTWMLSLAAAVMALALPAQLLAAGEQRFASPDEAVSALVSATRAKDTNALHLIFGPAAHDLISPDVVQATEEFQKFSQRLEEKVAVKNDSDTKATLHLGADGWPFAIPLVKQDGLWFFDTVAGREEILNRRTGQDEIGAIRVCNAYVSAQREYAAQDRNGDGIMAYAEHLRSAAGQHDGLYWPAKPGEELSPLGPLIAAAHQEGYRKVTKILTDEQSPYHGYYFKILTRQGKHALGGKYDYIINGHMIAGFALVAWPAEWGNTGVMTFVVNQQGKVFQKNLGPKTAAIVGKMTAYDPDGTWTPAQEN